MRSVHFDSKYFGTLRGFPGYKDESTRQSSVKEFSVLRTSKYSSSGSDINVERSRTFRIDDTIDYIIRVVISLGFSLVYLLFMSCYYKF